MDEHDLRASEQKRNIWVFKFVKGANLRGAVAAMIITSHINTTIALNNSRTCVLKNIATNLGSFVLTGNLVYFKGLPALCELGERKRGFVKSRIRQHSEKVDGHGWMDGWMEDRMIVVLQHWSLWSLICMIESKTQELRMHSCTSFGLSRATETNLAKTFYM